jgi:hypothetical protein
MPDLAEIRIKNTLQLFDEFKEANSPGAAPLLGLEKAFSAHLQISAAQWSQLKGGHRSIGATLARQFEARCNKPAGWLDQRHEAAPWAAAPPPAAVDGPRDPEERFAVALFLTAYRANPQKMKTRLLDLVQGELSRSSAPPKGSALRVASATKRT